MNTSSIAATILGVAIVLSPAVSAQAAELKVMAGGSMTASQVSAGRKNRLSLEVYGSNGSAAWDQERPDELWLGQRNVPNRILIKDPSLLQPGARPFADPGVDSRA